MKLRVILRDAKGVLVEDYTDNAEKAVAKAAAFMILQGVDPDGLGTNATEGNVWFQPVEAEEDTEGVYSTLWLMQTIAKT